MIAARIAARFPSRFLRIYVRGKMSSDPLYSAVYERLRDRDEPILDVGCGAGLLALYLREHGHRAPIRGIDHDADQGCVRRLHPAVGDQRDQSFRKVEQFGDPFIGALQLGR